ncbi:hypothetical protein GGR58DRAFT_504696 [Xylaria digitata]|nr:hypothetical protein GGR58DRAFT_504696 [Xylaria digitata]
MLTNPDLLRNSAFLDSLFHTQWTSDRAELDKPWRVYNSAVLALQLREFGMLFSNLTDLSRSTNGDKSTGHRSPQLWDSISTIRPNGNQSTGDENLELWASTSTIRPNPPMLVNGDEEVTGGEEADEEADGEANPESTYVKVLRGCNSTWSLPDFGNDSDGSSSKRRASI